MIMKKATKHNKIKLESYKLNLQEKYMESALCIWQSIQSVNPVYIYLPPELFLIARKFASNNTAQFDVLWDFFNSVLQTS